MLVKYIWLLFFISVIYVLYSNNYCKDLEKYLKRYYCETINNFYNTNSEPIFTNKDEIVFTTSILEKYTNIDDGLYLSILGQVFDVTNGAKHYGPGETYHAFTGRDGSAAFITGDFTESGLTDDISKFNNKEIQSLMNWVEFYRKTYIYKGKLIGRYYNKDGSPTNERYKLEQKVQIAEKNDSKEKQRKQKFPPCNIEWDEKTGTRVWCTKNSGGIVRNWIGVPRMLYDYPESMQHRCACIEFGSKEFEEHKNIIREFNGCSETSTACIIVPVTT